MSTQQDQNVGISTNTGSLPQHDIEEQLQVREIFYLDRRDSDGSTVFEGNEENSGDFLNGFQRRLRVAWNSTVSEISVESEGSTEALVPTNESSPLMNPRKATAQRTSNRTLVKQTWRWYAKRLDQRPVLTKALTSGFLAFVADFIGQCIEHQRLENHSIGKGNFDFVRLMKFSCMGLCLQAPPTHYFYVVLDYYLPPTQAPWTPTTFVKLTLDQLIFGPTITFVVILYLAIWGGSGWHGVQEQIEIQYWSTLVDNWKLWVPAQVINMAYVPPAYRVLYCNVVFFIWSIYLSVKLNT